MGDFDHQEKSNTIVATREVAFEVLDAKRQRPCEDPVERVVRLPLRYHVRRTTQKLHAVSFLFRQRFFRGVNKEYPRCVESRPQLNVTSSTIHLLYFLLLHAFSVDSC